MPRTIDFWFDYSCPYAYLASTRVEELARRTGAALRLRPMLLGGVFAANGTPQNLSAALAPSKARHNAADMHRWADRYGVALAMPAEHPRRTVEALRATLATARDPAVVHGFFRAYWVEGRDPSAPETIRAVVAGAGRDAAATLARIGTPELKDELRRCTDEAIARGVFGAPSFVVDGSELYFGQDRMALIEHAVAPDDRVTPARAARAVAPTLEVYWDFSSPYAYLGAAQAARVAARTGARLVWRPLLLGGLFRAIGQVDVPLASYSAAKQKHVREDLARWARHWGVPYRFPSRFPMNTVKALRVYLALGDHARRDAYRDATFHAYWAADRDIADDAVLRELIGPDGDAVLARAQTPEVKQALIDATRAAERAGVFGVPTWVIDGAELFWGQDRLALVESALMAAAQAR